MALAFRGQHEHNIDAKDRITVPAAHRAVLSEGIVLIEGVERCIEVWPQAAAEAMESQWINPLSPMGADGRRIRRRVFGTSEQTELDSAGRVRLPQHLIAHAALDGPSLVVGVGDHLEIWNRKAWEGESEEFEAKAAELTERLASQGPAAAGAEAAG